MMNAGFFEAWFKQHLTQLLAQDTVVIMDNASFHSKNCLNDIAKEYGIK